MHRSKTEEHFQLATLLGWLNSPREAANRAACIERPSTSVISATMTIWDAVNYMETEGADLAMAREHVLKACRARDVIEHELGLPTPTGVSEPSTPLFGTPSRAEPADYGAMPAEMRPHAKASSLASANVTAVEAMPHAPRMPGFGIVPQTPTAFDPRLSKDNHALRDHGSPVFRGILPATGRCD